MNIYIDIYAYTAEEEQNVITVHTVFLSPVFFPTAVFIICIADGILYTDEQNRSSLSLSDFRVSELSFCFPVSTFTRRIHYLYSQYDARTHTQTHTDAQLHREQLW